MSTAEGSELWEATCTPYVDADCPPDISVNVGTYLGHPSVVDFIENDSDNDVVDHYAFLSIDQEPSDGMVGAGFRESVCLNKASKFSKMAQCRICSFKIQIKIFKSQSVLSTDFEILFFPLHYSSKIDKHF